MERYELPQWVWGEAQGDIRFVAYFSQKVQLWWRHFLLRSFCPGAVATIALWKSAPVHSTDTAVTLTLLVMDESRDNKVVYGVRGLHASICYYYEPDNDVVSA